MKSFVILLEVVIATVVASGIGGHIYNDEYDVDDEEGPSFTATAQEFTVEVGGDITFHCDAENMGEETLMFRHYSPSGDKFIFVGEMILKDRKYFTKKGNSFDLNGALRRHAGKYECRIEGKSVIQLMHTLNVQYPATVTRVSPFTQNVPKGSTVVLECSGEGNPKAAISFSKEKGSLPSGEQSVEGSKLVLHNVDRYVEGTYICTASNGVGPPAQAKMHIEVEYPPEINTEETMLHTGVGDKASLVCIVHGRPSPSVSWMKDGKPLRQDEHSQDHDGFQKHTLTIDRVEDKHFGDYTCVAENQHGRKNQTLRLTGLPKTPRMTSSPAGGERNSYTITWETESNSDIRQYRLKYRKAKMGQLGPHIHGGWDDRLYPYIPLQKVENFGGPIIRMTHPIPNLEPATDYEASVSVENKYGWSNDSDVFRFHTRKEVAVGQSASRGNARVFYTPLLLVMVLCAFFANCYL